MEKFTLLGKTYEISPTAQEFLKAYLVRMDSFIASKRLSLSYGEDIRERIAEKLSLIENTITDTQVVKMVNDIGEPEDIFRDTVWQAETTTVSEILKKPFAKNRAKGILFWVCAGIADQIGIDALWIRLLFIVFTVLWGAGFIIYIALAFLLPNTPASVNEADSIRENRRGLIDQFAWAVGGSFRGIFKLIIIFAFVSFGMFLLTCFIGGVIVSGFLLTGWVEIAKQTFPVIIPAELLWSAPILTILSLVVAVASFAAVVGKDLFNRALWISATIVTAISLVFFSIGIFKVVKEYSWSEVAVVKNDIVYTGSTLSIDNFVNSYNRRAHGGSLFGDANIYTRVYVEKSNSLTGSIRVETLKTVHTKNSDSGKNVLASMSNLTATLSGSTLRLEDSAEDFNTTIPYSFPEREVSIVVPSSVKVLLWDGSYVSGVDRDSYDSTYMEGEEITHKVKAVEIGTGTGTTEKKTKKSR